MSSRPRPVGQARGVTGSRSVPLAEVVLVVLVVGVLAAVGTPYLLAQERRGVDVAMKADARAIAQQLQAFRLEDDGGSTKAAYAPPTLTLSGASLTMAPDNTPRIFRKGRDRFCIQVTNPQGTDPAHGVVWKTDAGGLQAAGQSCAGYRTVVL